MLKERVVNSVDANPCVFKPHLISHPCGVKVNHKACSRSCFRMEVLAVLKPLTLNDMAVRSTLVLCLAVGGPSLAPALHLLSYNA